jgi:hypothetical protein
LEGRAQRKVPGGKLVKIRVLVHENRIQDVRIMGDFFLHPEEVILDIERSLVGAGVEEEPSALERRIDRVLKEKGAELIGLEPRDIALALKEALP